jgi:trehalose 6-phosphate phosphatase
MTRTPKRLSLSAFRRKLIGHDHLLIMLDYDGTVVPIRKHPAQAFAPKSLRTVLQALADSRAVTMAIVSGRSPRDIRRLLPLRRIIRAGDHGFEISGLGMRMALPISRNTRSALHEVAALLRLRLGHIPGCLVEEKGVTISVHYRLVRARYVGHVHQTVRTVVAQYLRQRLVRLTRGKKVVEIRPPTDWDKGKAARAIVQHVKKRAASQRLLPLYCGDDVTDEDAFRALKNCGVTVHIGKSRQTAAHYYLPSSAEMVRFLKALSCMDWNRCRAS